MIISGHTRFIAHLGVPTESFKAPMIYNPWFEARGIDVDSLDVLMTSACKKPFAQTPFVGITFFSPKYSASP